MRSSRSERPAGADAVRRLLLLTGAIVFVDTMFFAALTPLLPHYVHTLHLSKASAGVLAAMYPAGALVAAIPGGVAVAHYGVKSAVLVGLTLLTITTIAFGIASAAWALDLARFLQGISSSFTWAGALSWLVAASPPGRRGQLIGSAFGAAIGGALFGPIIGVVASYAGTAPAFGGVAALAAGLFAAAWLTPAATPEQPQPLRMLFQAFTVPRMRVGIWLCLLPALLFGNLAVLAPLHLSHLGWGAAAVGATFLVSAAVEAAWSPVLGRASDRYGRFAPLRAALVAAAVVSLLLALPSRAWIFALLIVAAGFSYGSFWTPAMSMVTDEAESLGLDYGYAFALVGLAWAPGQAGGSAIGGAVASAASDAVPYVVLATLCLATFAAIARYGESASPVTAER